MARKIIARLFHYPEDALPYEVRYLRSDGRMDWRKFRSEKEANAFVKSLGARPAGRKS